MKILKNPVYIFDLFCGLFIRLLMAVHRWYGFAAQVRIFLYLNLTYLK